MTIVVPFLSGLVTAGFLTGALFFVRFWIRSRDLLFLAFGVAFAFLALNQALLTIIDIPQEEKSSLYLLRLIAFLLIAAAIVNKNRGEPD